MFTDVRNLIVVYKEKDEIALNQLKKMVDTNDDNMDDETIVGTEDKSVKIISWSEKVWLDNKKAGNVADLDDKILFLSDIKGVDKLIPTLDIKFERHGVKYGFSGKQAAIIIEPKKLIKKEDYDKFIKELEQICDSTVVKEKRNLDFNDKTKNVKNGLQFAASTFIFGPLGAIGKAISSVVTDLKVVRNQQLLYAVIKLYHNDLEKFMKN